MLPFGGPCMGNKRHEFVTVLFKLPNQLNKIVLANIVKTRIKYSTNYLNLIRFRWCFRLKPLGSFTFFNSVLQKLKSTLSVGLYEIDCCVMVYRTDSHSKGHASEQSLGSFCKNSPFKEATQLFTVGSIKQLSLLDLILIND